MAGGVIVINAKPFSSRGAYASTDIAGSVDFRIGMSSVISLAFPITRTSRLYHAVLC